ncbi:enoyl-CoA hydratase [Bacillus solimangrovi]|uniref:Enoyl-CoA hydratase n=1 Tax=Bacillus solimangrovi TaxID=1305675 RepID=A0A1E5LCU8_9BACI|nr:enoyl-CoA hydratase [Bacillus solimangrovi]OEH91893.1 enoyl-CoA hydratase [Bacillus solimangrovi]
MEFLTIEKLQNVATIIINRPPANALARAVLEEFSEAFDVLEDDDNIRAIVIRGEGRFFCAGADIKEFTTLQEADDYAQLAKRGQHLFRRMETFSKPVIAAIHGAALGGGLELAMACHVRIATKDAKLGLPELQLGIIPGFAGTQRLPRYVGTSRALEMMLTSEPISGADAESWGLVNRTYDESEELFAEAQTLAEKFAAKGALSVKSVIELLQYTKGNSFDAGVEREAELFGEVFMSEDGNEGVQAFIEKRKPQFNK